MKFIVFFVMAVLAVAQAKYFMSPEPLFAAMDRNEVDDGPVQAAMITEKLFIPMARSISCTNAGCAVICLALGYKHGLCVSRDTCECYN